MKVELYKQIYRVVKITLLVVVATSCSYFQIDAQTLLKAKPLGDTGEDFGYAIVSDASNNVFILGTFQNTVDFNVGAGTYTLTSRGSADVFLCKYNSSNVFQWAVNIGGTGDDQTGVVNTTGGGNLAVDGSGNAYVTGQYTGTAYFNAAQTVSVTTQGGQDVFFAKYDASGNCTWAKGIGGTGTEYCGGIAVDGSGNVATTGFFDSDPVDCEPGTGSFILPKVSGAAFDGFHAVYNSSGDCVWASALVGAAPSGGRGGSPNMYGCVVAFDGSGNSYFSGTYAARAIFGATNLDVVHDFDVYLAKYNSTGTLQWAKSMGGAWQDYPTAITTDASDNIYLVGKVPYGGDFDPGAGTAYLNDPDNVAKVVTITLTGTSGTANINIGNEMPAKTATFNTDLSTTASDFVTSFAADYAVGGLTVTSSGADLIFTSPIKGWDFSASIANATGDLSGSTVVTTAAVYNGGCLFFAKYDSDGNYVWANLINNGGSGTSHIGLNSSGDVFLTGNLQGTHDFDPGAGTENLSSAGGSDIFMARYTNDGNYKGANVFGDTGNDEGYFISVASDGIIYVSGSFQNTIDLDPIGTTTITSLGGKDAFYAAYGPGFLPVELLSFTGEYMNENAELEWATATETGNDYFTLERSFDVNRNDWTKIAQIKGSGYSSSKKNYSFTDETPLAQRLNRGKQTIYYRLTQTDFDGSTSKGKIISLQTGTTADLTISPNPSQGPVYLSLDFDNDHRTESVLVVVRDVLGKEYYSKLEINSDSSEPIILDLTGKLSPGVYLITASSSQAKVSRKLIIR